MVFSLSEDGMPRLKIQSLSGLSTSRSRRTWTALLGWTGKIQNSQEENP